MKTNKDIAGYIYDEYIFNKELDTVSDLLSKIDLLEKNGLAVIIKGGGYSDDPVNMYKVASLFLTKYDKKLKKKMKKDADLSMSETRKYADNDKEINELFDYELDYGIYFIGLEDDEYAIINVIKDNRDNGGYSSYFTEFELFFVGKKCNKYKDKFLNLYKKYQSLNKKKKRQYLIFSDNRSSKQIKFKSFDSIVFKDKEKILKYIDNWKDNIPKYNSYGIIPKLSILLYGKPGVGKSTFYKALADYLGIDDVCVVSASYFYDPEEYRRRLFKTIYALDDIDTYVQSREDDKDSENGKALANLLSFLDNPDTFYYKANDGLFYPISIVVATTNYYDRLDDAVKRFGRFDLKIEMHYFNKDEAEEMCRLYGLHLNDVYHKNIKENFSISPAELEALCLANIDSAFKGNLN